MLPVEDLARVVGLDRYQSVASVWDDGSEGADRDADEDVRWVAETL